MDKKLADYLWTARWATKADRPELAYDEITNALYRIGALKSPIDSEPEERPDVKPVIPVSKFTEPNFVTVKGTRFKEQGPYRTTSGMFKGLTVHYTVSGRTSKSAIGVVKYLAREGFGCMVMDEDGIIYIPEGFDILRDVAWHAGDSAWEGKTGMSRYMAGMEICCWGRGSKVGPYRESKGEDNIIFGKYQAYTEAQEASLINFCLWALDVNPEFVIDWIAGHDELRAEAGRPGDKQDPGGSLSMTMPEFRALIKKRSK